MPPHPKKYHILGLKGHWHENSLLNKHMIKAYPPYAYFTHFFVSVPLSEWTFLQNRDVNVHKNNWFFRLNFQFVSISKRNFLFYSGIAVIESKLKAISFTKSVKITKAKRNETYFWANSKKRNVLDTKKAKRWHSKPKTCFCALKTFQNEL
jgi:hypothetical protein